MNLGDKKPGKTPTRSFYVYYIIVGVIIAYSEHSGCTGDSGKRCFQKTDYSTFIKSVEKGNVTRATMKRATFIMR